MVFDIVNERHPVRPAPWLVGTGTKCLNESLRTVHVWSVCPVVAPVPYMMVFKRKKSIWWMPWCVEAMKDVARCDKLRGVVSKL